MLNNASRGIWLRTYLPIYESREFTYHFIKMNGALNKNNTDRTIILKCSVCIIRDSQHSFSREHFCSCQKVYYKRFSTGVIFLTSLSRRKKYFLEQSLSGFKGGDYHSASGMVCDCKNKCRFSGILLYSHFDSPIK